MGPLPAGAEWIGSTMNSRTKGTVVLSVWKKCQSAECREALRKHSQLRHELEDPKVTDEERETLLYDSYQKIREVFEVVQEAKQVSLKELSDAMFKMIIAVVGTMVDPKLAYIGLRNRVQKAVDAYDAEAAKSIGSTDLGLLRKDLAKLRYEVN